MVDVSPNLAFCHSPTCPADRRRLPSSEWCRRYCPPSDRALSPPILGGDVDTMPLDRTRLLKLSKPLLPSRLRFWNYAQGSREIVMYRTRHGAFSTFRRRILQGGYTAKRILSSGTLEGPAGWSFNPSAEGAMTTAVPPLSLLICPCLSYCHRTTVTARVVTHSSVVVYL